MRTTRKHRSGLDVLRPGSILVFVGLMVTSIIVSQGPDWDSFSGRLLARLAGYGAFVALLVPYVHVARRGWCAAASRPMRCWLRWHMAAGYLGFLLVLIHSRGRANGPLTQSLLWFTWVVVGSGVLGFYGQKLLYVLLPRLVTREFGLERLEPQRLVVLAAARAILEQSVMKQGPELIRLFGATAVRECFAPPFAFGKGWLHSPTAELLSDNWYRRTQTFADPEQSAALTQLRELVRFRQEMDLEYRLHQLGRLWLLLHGPAAWALLLLMIEHAASSMWYGGF